MSLPHGVATTQSGTAEAVHGAAEERAWSESALYDLVYRQINALTGGRRDRDMEDLVQIAALAVMKAYPSFEGRCALSTFTYRICYRTLLQQQRWYRRWLKRFAWSVNGTLPDTSDGGDDTDQQMLAAERSQRLRSALALVSMKRRAVLVLRDLDNLSIPDIAAIVGTPENTVRSRLRDGRKDLARLLADDPYFGDESCAQPREDS